MFIRSERLFLRPAWPEDWAELHAVIDDVAVVRNLSARRGPIGRTMRAPLSVACRIRFIQTFW